MGIREWLPGNTGRPALSEQARVSLEWDIVEKLKAFHAESQKSRMSQGGNVPDAIIDEMIANFERSLRRIIGG
jgi:hypothetical protein